MGQNLVRKIIWGDQNWTCPAGVKRVKVSIYGNVDFSYLGDSHSQWLGPLGDAAGCGFNFWGNLGDNTRTDRSTAVLVLGSNRHRQVKAGGDFSLYLSAGAEIYSVGGNSAGQLGNNSATDRSTQVAVSGGFFYRTIGAGFAHGMGLRTTGGIYTWGYNNYGQLGVGDTNSRSTPTLVGSSARWKYIEAGGNTCFAIDKDDNLYGWGQNDSGQLGVGDTQHRSTPTLVLGGGKYTKVYPSQNPSGGWTVALNRNGQMSACGDNSRGQLGLNDIASRSTLTSILGGQTFVRAAVGNYHVLALSRNVGLYVWGGNDYGQLGLNSIAHRSSPAQSSTLTTNLPYGFAINLAAGAHHSMVSSVNSQVYVCGKNGVGQLGLGDVADRSTALS